MVNQPSRGRNLLVGQEGEKFGKVHKRKKIMRKLMVIIRI